MFTRNENKTVYAVFAQQHLDKAGVAYLTGINGADSESYYTMEQKLALLARHLKNPRSILSVGIGAGEEIETLSRLFPFTTKYIGIDLSSVALGVVKDKLKLPSNPILTMGNAVQLPFANDSLDGIVYSAVLHEVFSYMPWGVTAWSSAVAEGVRVLAPDGYMLIRDPAAPKCKSSVNIVFKTEFSQKFYDYFSAFYRVDNGSMNNLDYFPPRGKSKVKLERSQAGELLMHFRNFARDYKRGLTHFGDPEWKEIKEAYFFYEEGISLPPEEYAQKVLRIGEKFSLILVGQNISPRPEINQFLSEHFLFTDHQENEDIIADCTQKMELLFQKKQGRHE